MKKWFQSLQYKVIILTVIILLILGVSLLWKKSKEHNQQAISPSDVYYLTPIELKKLPSKAEAGDAEAARKLFDYYLVTHEPYDEKAILKWTQVAAKLGYSTAQHYLAVFYLRKHNLDQAIQSAWQAAKDGNASGQLEDAIFYKETEKHLKDYINKAQKGDSNASYRLHKFYYYEASTEIYSNEILEKKREESDRWLNLAISQGNVKALDENKAIKRLQK